MSPILEAEVALTSQNQITIPASIREILKIKGGKSRVRFQLRQSGDEVMVVVTGLPKDEDPALRPFLDLIAKDMERHPERIKPFPVDLIQRARAAVEGVEVDLDGALTGAD